jgi:hypothetical protein
MATLSGFMVFEQADGFQYSINFSAAITTAKVLMQLQFTSAMSGEIVEIAVDGQSDTADAMEIVVARYSAVSSSGTSFTPIELVENGPASTTTNATNGTGVVFTTEGTIGDILLRRDASVQAGGGFYWSRGMGGAKPTRLYLAASGIVGVKSNITIT